SVTGLAMCFFVFIAVICARAGLAGAGGEDAGHDDKAWYTFYAVGPATNGGVILTINTALFGQHHVRETGNVSDRGVFAFANPLAAFFFAHPQMLIQNAE